MEELVAGAIVLPRAEVRVMERCTSTNDVLMRTAGGERPVLLAAEVQTAGRGRRGRRWHSRRGAGLTFSLAVALRRPVRELAALPLVAGVACARALRALGVARACLKWPNDLVVDDAKLGGILVETRAAGERTLAVIGVGINCLRDRTLENRVRRRVAALEQFVEVDRNAVLGALGHALLDALEEFERDGLANLRAEWEGMDAHAGRRLRVRLAGGKVVSGVAAGLAHDGGLQLRTRAGLRAVTSGRVVSSRLA